MNTTSLLHPLRRPAAAAAVLTLALGCGNGRDAAWDEGFAPLPPVALDHSVLVVEAGHATAFLVDTTARRLLARPVPVGHGAALATRRAAHSEALVLCRGRAGSPEAAPEAATLLVLPEAAGPIVRYELGAPFSAMEQSEDGRFAIFFFGRDDDGGAGLLFNPNEIAIVDLGKPPGPGNPQRRTLRSFGGTPGGVVFTPAVELAGGPRRLAVALSDATVTLVDLDNLGRPEITVPLTLPDSPSLPRPRQVLVDIGRAGGDPTIYLRGDGSNDIYALRLSTLLPAEQGPGGNDFRPSVSQLGAGTRPADMALFSDGDKMRLLVVSPGSGDAQVIDAASSRVTRLALGAPANRIVLFDSGRQALLLGLGNGTSAATFVDLAGVETLRGRNVDGRSMGARVVDVLEPRPGLVLLVHDSGADGRGLSIVDLARRTASPIIAAAPLANGAQALGQDRLWLAPPLDHRLGFLDLDSFRPGEVRLDAPITGLLALEPERAPPVVVAFGDSTLGNLTLIDARDPRRETARTLDGYLLTDITARGGRP